MVFIAEYLWGDDWPAVAKRESNEADQEGRRSLENKDIQPLVLSYFIIA